MKLLTLPHLQFEAVKQWDMIKVALVTDLTLKQLFFNPVLCDVFVCFCSGK